MDSETIDAGQAIVRLRDAVNAGLVGHQSLVENLLVALLASGHVLLEGPPGIAKTRAVKLLASHIEGSTARIQCTPDLLPSDLVGTQIYQSGKAEFDFMPGPIFHSLVLVDEINRSPPKVQSALLEAMAENQVSVGGVTRPLPNPFMVVATQNPIEHEGTFPLPEAQLDRFLMQINLEMPNAEGETAILDLVEDELQNPPKQASFQISDQSILAMRNEVAQVHLAPALKDYIVRLVMATREGPMMEYIEHSVSPRGSLALAACARARASIHGRDHALPEDVQTLASDVLAHRLTPNWTARAEGKTARDIIADILSQEEPW